MAKDAKATVLTLDDELVEAHKALSESVREHARVCDAGLADTRKAQLNLETVQAAVADKRATSTQKKSACEAEVARLEDLIRQRDEKKDAA